MNNKSNQVQQRGRRPQRSRGNWKTSWQPSNRLITTQPGGYTESGLSICRVCGQAGHMSYAQNEVHNWFRPGNGRGGQRVFRLIKLDVDTQEEMDTKLEVDTQLEVAHTGFIMG